MIFPGMDPYLENPQIWPGVHARLIVYMCDQLQPLLQPKYVAVIGERVYAEIHETYLEIIHRESGRKVVTVIEILSPTNKYAGPGRASYLAKQQEILSSTSHLMEIDLLRLGPHVLSVPEYAADAHGPYDYLVCINRAEGIRDNYDLIPLVLRRPLPKIPLPLADDDADTLVDLRAILERAYQGGSYVNELDYDVPCVPRLSPEDQQWANECIKSWRQLQQAPTPSV